MVLCADIGGTNSNFGLLDISGKSPKIILTINIKTDSKATFPELILQFFEYLSSIKSMREISNHIETACFAVAGPVEDRNGAKRVQMTNTDHVIDSAEIMARTGLKKVVILNDFEAISYAVNILTDEDVIQLNRGKLKRSGETRVKAVIGAGTGLGKNILYHDAGKNAYLPLPSEGGHSDLPILDREDMIFSEHLKKALKNKHQLSYEDVLSGNGLEHIYSFFVLTKYPKEPKGLSAEQISATRTTNSASFDAFELFIKFYARCARNFVLDTLARGGLYIAGGIARKNPDAFGNFYAEYIKNDRFASLLKDVPIKLIKTPDISLLGCAYALMISKLTKCNY